jgi:hypothetical protein
MVDNVKVKHRCYSVLHEKNGITRSFSIHIAIRVTMRKLRTCPSSSRIIDDQVSDLLTSSRNDVKHRHLYVCTYYHRYNGAREHAVQRKNSIMHAAEPQRIIKDETSRTTTPR